MELGSVHPSSSTHATPHAFIYLIETTPIGVDGSEICFRLLFITINVTLYLGYNRIVMFINPGAAWICGVAETVAAAAAAGAVVANIKIDY